MIQATQMAELVREALKEYRKGGEPPTTYGVEVVRGARRRFEFGEVQGQSFAFVMGSEYFVVEVRRAHMLGDGRCTEREPPTKDGTDELAPP